MKKGFLSLPILALATTALTTWAEMPTQYPFLAPNCPVTIKTPDYQSPAAFSEDCKTAFVMPDAQGKFSITHVSKTANLNLCSGLQSLTDADNNIAKEIVRITGQLSTISIGDAKRDQILAEIGKLQEAQSKLFMPYEKVVGGYAQVLLSTTSENKRLQDFFWANAGEVNRGLTVAPAPISESYIAFTKHNPQIGDHPQVLDFQIAGIKPHGATGDVNVSIYRSGLNATGSVTLSLWGACPQKGTPANDPGVDIDAEITYNVPELAWAGYVATLDTRQALQNIITVYKRNGQFTKADNESIAATGQANTAFTFKATDLGLNIYTDSDKARFFADLQDTVATRLSAALVQQLADAGLAQFTQPVTPIDAGKPGSVSQTHPGGTVCHSGFLGIGGGCSVSYYTVTIPVDATADQIVQRYANLKLTNSETVEIREPVNRYSTIVFPHTQN